MSPELKTMIGREPAEAATTKIALKLHAPAGDEWAPRRRNHTSSGCGDVKHTGEAVAIFFFYTTHLTLLSQPGLRCGPRPPFWPFSLLVTGATAETKLYFYQSPPPWGWLTRRDETLAWTQLVFSLPAPCGIEFCEYLGR